MDAYEVSGALLLESYVRWYSLIMLHLIFFIDIVRSRSSSVSMETKLRDWITGVQFSVMGFFSLRHRVQTGSGAHSASYPMGTVGPFPRVNRPVHETDHTHLHLVSRLGMSGSVHPLPSYVFMAWRLIKQEERPAQGQLYSFYWYCRLRCQELRSDCISVLVVRWWNGMLRTFNSVYLNS
jgi:hypothetical protein